MRSDGCYRNGLREYQKQYYEKVNINIIIIIINFDAVMFLPIAWYRGLMVVGWCSTKISASNSNEAVGFSNGETITIPLRI